MGLSMVVDRVADIIGLLLMFNLQSMLKFTPLDVKKLAEDLVQDHKLQIARGFDSSNTPFTPYSPAYAKQKQVSRNSVNLKNTGKMLDAFQVQKKLIKKNNEIQILYGIKKNKQGTKMFNHNEGLDGMPKRTIAENNELGESVEDGLVNNLANIFGKNLSRQTGKASVIVITI